MEYPDSIHVVKIKIDIMQILLKGPWLENETGFIFFWFLKFIHKK
jgi:hypothetical protein